jgi:small subunit ribosomal protein S20
MPIIKSAKKRVRVSAKASARNAKTKRSLREAIKAFKNSLKSGKKDTITKAQNEAFKAIDVATKKHVMHKNKAARKKSQISLAAKAAGAKSTKKVTKKTSAAAKKSAKPAKAKKPAVKKTASSKS